MSWKNTWILVGLAGALFAFIALVERRFDPTGTVPVPKPLFAGFKPTAATAIQIRRGSQYVINLERTNGGWAFTKKFPYPAATFPIQSFLEQLERTVPATRISTREILSHKQTSADFGLDTPAIVVSIEQGKERRELRIGARTSAGDQLYLQVGSDPTVCVVGADLLDKLPRTQNDWRHTALFHLGGKVERCEVAHSGAGFRLQLDSTNQQWRLVHPPHRADQDAVALLLKKIVDARVVEFVTDTDTDAEAFGFATPEFEVTLGTDGAAQKVQFGRVATNDPTRVYARLMAHTNVVLVPKTLVDVLATPYSELRERQLAPFAPELIDSIEVQGDETFTVRRSANGGWVVDETPVDAVFVEQRLFELSRLKASEFVKDVVTDFAPFGLEPPLRQYSLRTLVTNATGTTNVLVARFDFGTLTDNGLVYARRWDEKSVYSIPLLEFSRMPSAAWQLRTHRVWNFTTNQLSRITVQEGASVREALRQPNGEWVPVKGWADQNLNPFALEEIALGLGQLHAIAWVARGPDVRAKFGFTPDAPKLSVELRGETPQVLTIEFGGRTPMQIPYGLMELNGQPTLFEFPWPLYGDLLRYFHLTAPPRQAPK